MNTAVRPGNGDYSAARVVTKPEEIESAHARHPGFLLDRRLTSEENAFGDNNDGFL
jgi:hypothetical protein